MDINTLLPGLREWRKLFTGTYDYKNDPLFAYGVSNPSPLTKIMESFDKSAIQAAPKVPKNVWNLYQYLRADNKVYQAWKDISARDAVNSMGRFCAKNRVKAIDEEMYRLFGDEDPFPYERFKYFVRQWEESHLFLDMTPNDASRLMLETMLRVVDVPRKPQFAPLPEKEQEEEKTPWKWLSRERRKEKAMEIEKKMRVRGEKEGNVIFAYYLLPSGGKRKIPGHFEYAPVYNDKKKEDRKVKSVPGASKGTEKSRGSDKSAGYGA
jgi:hypothetical protein